MNPRTTLTLVLFLILLASCRQTPEPFIGKWQILTVVEGNQSIDLMENWMHLKEDGSFESYDGALKKKESGKWTYTSETKQLFIDGEGNKGDSHWRLSLQTDTLLFHSITDSVYLISKKME